MVPDATPGLFHLPAFQLRAPPSNILTMASSLRRFSLPAAPTSAHPSPSGLGRSLL